MIEIRGLAKSYGAHQALKDVTLSIRPGEFVVVLGPSGAGKSTLLRCINRLAEPTGGEIVVEGTPFRSERPRPAPAPAQRRHDLPAAQSGEAAERAEERAGRPHGRSLARS